MNKCRFCKEGINPKVTKVLKEFKYCRVIFANPRLMPGHLLVIPKRHVTKLSELNPEELKDFMKALIIYQEKLLKIYPGCDIKQHYTPFIAEGRTKVRHLHLHIQPRELNDEYSRHTTIGTLYKSLPEKEFHELTKKLK